MYNDTNFGESHKTSDLKGKSKSQSIQLKDICALFFVSWSIVHVLSINSFFRILAFLCCGFFVLSILPRIQGVVLNYLLFSIALLAMLFGIIWIREDDLSFAVSRTINLFVFVMLGFFSIYYQKYEQQKFKYFAILIVLIYVIIAIPSLIAVQSDPYIMRQASGEKVRTGIELFAGGYGYVYGCVFLEPILVFSIKNGKHKTVLKILFVLLIVFFGYVIMNAGFTTAIVLTILGVVMALFVKKNGLKTIIIFSIFGVALLLAVPLVLDYIVKNFDIPQVYQQKIAVLMDITNSDNNTSYTDSTRGKLLIQGLTAILDYPILGSVILSGEHAAGGHQTLVDVMANYGLLYAVIYYFVIYYTAFRQLKNEPKLQLVIALLLTILGFTNTYDYATFMVPLLVGPYIANYISEKQSLQR